MVDLRYYGVLHAGQAESELFNNKLNNEEIINKAFNSDYEMSGWRDLPDMEPKLVKEITETASYINKNFTTFVLLGVGGSALGAKTLFKAFENKPRATQCLVFDNIDPSEFATVVKGLNLQKTMFNIVTKSGSTSETLLQMFLVMQLYGDKKLNYANHMIITTEVGNELYDFAQKNKIKTFIVPKNVGGRYSVFSAVGLLPASVFGINISKLLKGAKQAQLKSKNPNVKQNVALALAHINYQAYLKGKHQLVIMPYSQPLSLVSDYFAQLWAESLGKKYDRLGKIVNVSQTPIKALGITDQHSQLQLYTEGKNNKIFMFITIDSSNFDWRLKHSAIDKFDYLNNVSLHQLLNLEKQATAYSLSKNGCWHYTLSLPEVSEQTVGELLFLLQASTVFAGELFNVNAFDQPGVEDCKVYTKALLNAVGMENQNQEIKQFINKSENYIIK